jgi:hypothetical protein
MFMTRFRRRWGGRYGAISERDDAPIAELVEEAFMGSRINVLLGSNNGTKNKAARRHATLGHQACKPKELQ